MRHNQLTCSNFKKITFTCSFFQKGVTLTEILIALTIMAVALIPTIGVFNTGFKGTHKQIGFITALEIAEQELNNALHIPWKDLGDFTKEIEQGRIKYTVKLKIVYVDTPAQPVKFTYLHKNLSAAQNYVVKSMDLTDCVAGLELSVLWKDLIGKERTVSLKTLKTRI